MSVELLPAVGRHPHGAISDVNAGHEQTRAVRSDKAVPSLHVGAPLTNCLYRESVTSHFSLPHAFATQSNWSASISQSFEIEIILSIIQLKYFLITRVGEGDERVAVRVAAGNEILENRFERVLCQ